MSKEHTLPGKCQNCHREGLELRPFSIFLGVKISPSSDGSKMPEASAVFSEEKLICYSCFTSEVKMELDSFRLLNHENNLRKKLREEVKKDA